MSDVDRIKADTTILDIGGIYLSTRSNDAVNVGNVDLGAEKFNPRRLTPDVWDNEPFDWTRDSKAVLFQSIRGGRTVILEQRIDQQTQEVLRSGAESYQQPTFSPGRPSHSRRTSDSP